VSVYVHLGLGGFADWIPSLDPLYLYERIATITSSCTTTQFAALTVARRPTQTTFFPRLLRFNSTEKSLTRIHLVLPAPPCGLSPPYLPHHAHISTSKPGLADEEGGPGRNARYGCGTGTLSLNFVPLFLTPCRGLAVVWRERPVIHRLVNKEFTGYLLQRGIVKTMRLTW
jgi:hypothetical protein